MVYKYKVGDTVTIKVPELDEEGVDALVGFKPPSYCLEMDGREYKISYRSDYFCVTKCESLPLYYLDSSSTDSTGTTGTPVFIGFDEHWLLPTQPDIGDDDIADVELFI